jgi:hypothetical protein
MNTKRAYDHDSQASIFEYARWLAVDEIRRAWEQPHGPVIRAVFYPPLSAAIPNWALPF